MLRKTLAIGSIFTLGSLVATGSSAALLNPSFENSFEYWQAEASIDNLGALSTEIGDAADYSGISAGSSSATLTNYSDQNIGDIYGLVLFQDFSFDAINPGEQLLLSLDVDYGLTDGFVADFAFAQLRNLDDNSILDVLDGGVFDVTSWIGANTTFEFGLFDGDYQLGDWITVSNLSVDIAGTEPPSSVPEPSTLFLFSLGLVAMGVNRKIISKS